MNAAYKLVVVQPFGSYQRGHVIYDQKIVNEILDVNHEMHHYEQHVRRVPLSEKEILMASPPSEPVVESQHDQQTILIETIADVPVDSDTHQE